MFTHIRPHNSLKSLISLIHERMIARWINLLRKLALTFSRNNSQNLSQIFLKLTSQKYDMYVHYSWLFFVNFSTSKWSMQLQSPQKIHKKNSFQVLNPNLISSQFLSWKFKMYVNHNITQVKFILKLYSGEVFSASFHNPMLAYEQLLFIVMIRGLRIQWFIQGLK